MNSYIRKTILTVALVLAAFCVQSCTKNGMTPEERLIERRERTFSSKDRIMSFYLNGNLVCDDDTWNLCKLGFGLTPSRSIRCYKIESEGYLHLSVCCTESICHLASGTVRLRNISFYIPYENDEFLLNSIRIEAYFSKGGYYLDTIQFSVSAMDFEIVDYDEVNEYIMGRFSFNATWDFGDYEDCPKSVNLLITDGMFNAGLHIQKPL